MIDFIKIYTDKKENLEHRIKNNLEDTICALNFYTGEVQYPCRQYAQNMEVRVTKNRGIIRNSIHKFFNMEFFNESNNHSDFNLSELELALQSLSQKFGKEIMDYKVTNLEFGLNIETSLPAQKILENNFIMYNFDNFSQLDTFKNRGYYKQYNRTEYYLKFYDKGKQYKLPQNLLRVEVKIIERRLLQKMGVNFLSDIKNPEVLQQLFKFFIEKVNETNIIDNSFLDDIPCKEKNIINIGKSPSFWLDLLNNKSKSSYYETRKRYDSMLEKYNLLTIKDEIISKLNEKFKMLVQPSST